MTGMAEMDRAEHTVFITYCHRRMSYSDCSMHCKNNSKHVLCGKNIRAMSSIIRSPNPS